MTDALTETKSTAVTRRERVDALVAAVEQKAHQLQTLLAQTAIPFSRFVEVFRRALIHSPDIAAADAGSVIKACIDAATIGLLPDGRNGAIVVYNQNVAARNEPKRYAKVAQFLPMVQGLLDIAYKSGNFKDIQARVVYEGDEFDYELGITPTIKHKPARRPVVQEGAKPREIVAAYAVAKGVDGGEWIEVFEGADIQKVRAVSRATSGPNKDWPEEMARKGPLRRMWKYLPKSERMERVVDVDDQNFDLEVVEVPPPKVRKLEAGFAALPPQEPQSVETAAEPPQEPQDGDFTEPSPEGAEQQTGLPATFLERVGSAANWLGIKQALRSLANDYPDQIAGWRNEALESAWSRFFLLREAGTEATDIVTDTTLFEAWIVGQKPDADSVEGNWCVVESTAAFKRLTEADQARLRGVVQSAKGPA